MIDEKQSDLPDEEKDDLGESTPEDSVVYKSADLKRILLEDPQGFFRVAEEFVAEGNDCLAPLLEKGPRQTEKQRRIRVNRRYRTFFGDRRLPYPEADNLYEKIRGKITHAIKKCVWRYRDKKRAKMK